MDSPDHPIGVTLTLETATGLLLDMAAMRLLVPIRREPFEPDTAFRKRILDAHHAEVDAFSPTLYEYCGTHFP